MVKNISFSQSQLKKIKFSRWKIIQNFRPYFCHAFLLVLDPHTCSHPPCVHLAPTMYIGLTMQNVQKDWNLMLDTEVCSLAVVQCHAGVRRKLLKKCSYVIEEKISFPLIGLKPSGNTVKCRTAMAYLGYSVQYPLIRGTTEYRLSVQY